MRRHNIKIKSEFADEIVNKNKQFEIRLNDRMYQKGDEIVFKVIDENGNEFNSHRLNGKEYRITFVASGFGIENGYVVLGIKEE